VRDISREVRLLVGRFGSARARPLTLRQQQRLAWRAQAGDRQAGAKLVESCLGLVVAVATEHGKGPIITDMVQNGVVELLERLYGRPNKRYPNREVTRYDPERGVKFWTFARPYVLDAIRDTFERPSADPLPEDEYNVPEPLRDEDPAVLMLQELREEEIQQAYTKALEAVRVLPDPDRPVFLLRHGFEGPGVARQQAAELLGVSERDAKTALQRATRTLERDGRVRALKRLVGYETTKDLREQQRRAEALYELVGPAPPPRRPVPYPDPPPPPRVIPEGPYNPYRKHPGTFGGEVTPPEGMPDLDPRIWTQPPTWIPNPDPGPWDVPEQVRDEKQRGTWIQVAVPDSPYARGVLHVFVPPHVQIRTPGTGGVLPIPTHREPLSARERADLLLALQGKGKERKIIVSQPRTNP
jgi:RNA polymerase sigma factor (sigma-70 family)